MVEIRECLFKVLILHRDEYLSGADEDSPTLLNLSEESVGLQAQPLEKSH